MALPVSTLVFKKKLQNTDVLHRLSVPAHSLHNLPRFTPGQNQMSFLVLDEGNGSWFKFHCYKRKKGSYSKPVLSKGWLDFVQRKGLRVGDVVTLYKVTAPGLQVLYRISVVRTSIRLFGVDINIES